MTESAIKKYDTSNMRALLVQFPDQIREAVEIGKQFTPSITTSGIRNVVVTGLGGSAIGGDVLRAYVSDKAKVPFFVNRHYFLPEFVDKNTLVIVASYSGNTEETTAVYKDAMKRGARIICISSNGTIGKLALKNGHPLIVIPKGFPPRAALGYSFFPVLTLMEKLGLIPSPDRDIKETLSLLDQRALTYSQIPQLENRALDIATKLKGKLPIIYSSADRFDVVNVRWRGQIAENAKVLAFGHVYPEMNHNELVGWSQAFHSGKSLTRQMKDMAVIFLRDSNDHKRVQLRMDITKGIIGKLAGDVIEVYSEGKSPLTRMFSLIYLGDWVSYYLAIINQVDPTPVKVIDYLKDELSKV